MSTITKYEVAVIGGGPAGLFAAGKALSRGKKTVIIEKNNGRLGKKLLITGKGRCNLTNNADISDFFDNIVKNREFLYSAFYSFTNRDLMEFFESNGVPLKVERGERVFPNSDRSMDILNVLKKYVKDADIIYEAAEAVAVKDGRVEGVVLKSGGTVYADSVILASGGLSYPLTGSTGDGYRMAKQIGHKITKLKPALVPLILHGDIPKRLEGLSLKNVEVRLVDEKGKKIYDDFGEMLFTAKGVSGPVILSMSSYVPEREKTSLLIDLKPALSEQKLDERIRRDFLKYANKNYINSLSDLLPSKLIEVVAELSEIEKTKKVNQITAAERKKLLCVLKNLKFDIKCKGSINDAIITDGGVEVSEINPSTMESKIIGGLFFAGEIIDVHGYTGGFNLQIAFSTAYLAADSC